MTYGVFTENDDFPARGVLSKKHNLPSPGDNTMSDPAHILKPPTDEAPREILDLADAIAQLPLEYRLRVEPTLNRVLENARRRRRILSLVQDALGQLRLDMKYLTFDLEATRRERDDYRQKLEGPA